MKGLQINKLRSSIQLISSKIAQNPMGALLSVYYERVDLQRTFPEVVAYDYKRLLKWARDTVKGLTGDYSVDKLRKFSEWYTQIGDNLSFMDNELTNYKHQLEATNNELTNYKHRLEATNNELTNYKHQLEATNNELTNYKHQLEATNNELTNYKHQLETIRNSFTWRFLRKIDNKFPEGTRRGEFKKTIVKSLQDM